MTGPHISNGRFPTKWIAPESAVISFLNFVPATTDYGRTGCLDRNELVWL